MPANTAPQSEGGREVTAAYSAEAPPAPAGYRIVRLLGRGGMGEVYLAHNELMDRAEVLKVVHPELLSKPGALERFHREIRSAARLQHPNIVTAYSCLQVGNGLAFAMEYVPGRDLHEVVRSGGPLAVMAACHYTRQAALGLQHAHEKGMVHRDVKPHNLILAKDGNKPVVKILDFGLAKIVGDGAADNALTGSGRMMGTPDYIAPEQTLDAARADIRADVYSLGCTLYYFLVGRPPFPGLSLYETLEAHHTKEAPRVSVLRPEVPDELAGVIAKMMAKAPDRRYQTPAEVVQAMHPYLKFAGREPGTGTVRAYEKSADQPEARSTAVAVRTSETVPSPSPPPLPKVKASTQIRRPADPKPARTKAGEEGITDFDAVVPALRPGRAAPPPHSMTGVLVVAAVIAVLAVVAVIGLWAGGAFKTRAKPQPVVEAEPPAKEPERKVVEIAPKSVEPAKTPEPARPDPAISRRRGLRWVLKFQTASGRDYVNQFAALKATLVFQKPGGLLAAYRELDAAKPAEMALNPTELLGVSFTDSKEQSVTGVADTLGLGFRPTSFTAYFPKEIEDRLVALERAHAGRGENEIVETKFDVRVRDGLPIITVVEQTPVGAPPTPNPPTPPMPTPMPPTPMVMEPKPPSPPRVLLTAGNFGVGSRTGPAKEAAKAQFGATLQSELAVARGLAWLARQQKATGEWTFDGSSKDEIAATSMALMAFLGAGETTTAGSHQKAVAAGLAYLQKAQLPTGAFKNTSNMYSHGLATIALCEAYAMTEAAGLQTPARRAVQYLVNGQGPNGSWGYLAKNDGDTSIVGWQVQALHAARLCNGLVVPDATRQKASRFLTTVASGPTKGLFGYREPGSSPCLTAVGQYSRFLLDGWTDATPGMRDGVAVLLQHRPGRGDLDLYRVYYQTQAIRVHQGNEWHQTWQPHVRDLLVGLQNPAGYWEKDGAFIGASCGRLGTTCFALWTLQTPYRYGPAPAKK